MAKDARRDDQAGHDLVADAQIKRRVKGVVRQRDPGRQCDHVARKQRQLHPRLALCHAIAHRGHTACHLRRGPHPARGLADLAGIGFKRLMRRQHVVVGSDDANVRAAGRRERFLVRPHGRIGVGLIAAGQMSARRSGGDRFYHPLQILPAQGFRTGTNAVGDTGDCGVKRHRSDPWQVRFGGSRGGRQAGLAFSSRCC